jgi:hypothetical protein
MLEKPITICRETMIPSVFNGGRLIARDIYMCRTWLVSSWGAFFFDYKPQDDGMTQLSDDKMLLILTVSRNRGGKEGLLCGYSSDKVSEPSKRR